MPKEDRNAREFFHRLNIEEKWNTGGTQVDVTFTDGGDKYRIKGLCYQPEVLWHPMLSKAVKRSNVLDWHKHDWPDGQNNTDKIIEEMVDRSRDDKEPCRIFLEKLCDHVKSALANGDAGNLRHYWPNILNNNHWHDVASFIKLCLEQPREAAQLVSLCQEGADVFPLNRLVYRWLPNAVRNKGRYKGINRFAFHGKYQMIERLLSPTRLSKGGLPSKYGSIGEGKDHRELKEYLKKHPEKLGLKDIESREMEWIFKSGDRADLVFWHKRGGITLVEIETDIPDPGAHQLIKYRALLCAQNGWRLGSPKVRAILVAWSVPPEVSEFCSKYGMSWQEYRLPR